MKEKKAGVRLTDNSSSVIIRSCGCASKNEVSNAYTLEMQRLLCNCFFLLRIILFLLKTAFLTWRGQLIEHIK